MKCPVPFVAVSDKGVQRIYFYETEYIVLSHSFFQITVLCILFVALKWWERLTMSQSV